LALYSNKFIPGGKTSVNINISHRFETNPGKITTQRVSLGFGVNIVRDGFWGFHEF